MRLKVIISIILFTIGQFFLTSHLHAQLSKNLIEFLPAVYKPNPVSKTTLTTEESLKIFEYAEAYMTTQVIKELDSLGKILVADTITEKNDSIRIEICRQLTTYSLNANNFESALKYCEATLRYCEKNEKYKTRKRSFQKMMGAIYAGLGSYEQSIRYFYSCLDIAKAENDSIGVAEIYSGISYPYALLGMYNFSISNLDSSIAYFGHLTEDSEYYPELEDARVSRCGKYIYQYEKTGNKIFGEKAAELINTAQARKNHHYFYDIYPVGIAYFDKNYERTLLLSDSLIKIISAQNPAHKSAMINYINKYRALIFLNTDKSEIGVSILKQMIDNFRSQKNPNGNAYANIILFSRNLCTYYKNNHNWKEAFAYQEMNKNYTDSLKVLENRTVVFEQELKYNFSKKEEQLKMLQHSNTVRSKERNLALAGSYFLLLCIILIALLSHNINNRLKIKKAIAQKKAEFRIEKLQMSSQLQIAELEEKNNSIKKEEQKKLGMELHDNLAANLACVSLMLDMQIHNTSEKKTQAQLSDMRQIISEMYNSVRDKSHELYSAANENADYYYSKRITDLLKETLPDMFKTQISIDNESLSATSLQVKIEILYIIREAIANIIKHANASKVSILIYKDVPGIILIINDNGKGFNSAFDKNGMGLSSIKKRANSVNGNAEIFSGKNGTEIKITIPV